MRLQYALIGAATLLANTDIVSANTNFAPTTLSTTTRAIDTGLVFDAFNGKRYLRISKPINDEASGGETEERLPVISFYKDEVTAQGLIKFLRGRSIISKDTAKNLKTIGASKEDIAKTYKKYVALAEKDV